LPLIKGSTAADNWIAISLATGWTNNGNPYPVAQFRRENRRIFLKGAVVSDQTTSLICTLPTGYRPAQSTVCLAGTFGSITFLQFEPSGNVICLVATAGLHLEGVNFGL